MAALAEIPEGRGDRAFQAWNLMALRLFPEMIWTEADLGAADRGGRDRAAVVEAPTGQGAVLHLAVPFRIVQGGAQHGPDPPHRGLPDEPLERPHRLTGREGTFPCQVLRGGRYWKVRTVELLRSPGLNPDGAPLKDVA